MRKMILAVAALLAVATGVIAVVGVGAQSPTPTTTADGQTRVDNYIAKLASELNIDEAALRTAMLNANLSLVDDAAAAGDITADQAATARQRIQDNNILLPGFGRHGHHGPKMMFFGNAVETVLGIDQATLRSELEGGNTLAQVAENHGMTVDAFKSALLAEVKTDLDAKVADGSITQARADEAYQHLSDNIDNIINHVPGEHGPGHGPGFEGPDDDGDDVAPSSTGTTTPGA